MNRTITAFEKLERKQADGRRGRLKWLLAYGIPNLARGLTVLGQVRRKPKRLSPETQRLLAEYLAQQKQQPLPVETVADVPMSALEQQWRELRASMGEITVPSPEIGLRGEYERAPGGAA